MEKRSAVLAKNTIILSIGNLCTKGIMFIITPLLTRWLTTYDYGIFDLLTTYTSLIIPLMTFDIGEAAFRQLLDENTEEKKASIISNAALFYLVALGLCTILIAVLSYINPAIQSYMLGFAVFIYGEALYSFFSLLLRGLKKLDSYAFANIVFVFVMALTSLIYIRLLSLKVTGILLAYATGYIISSLYMAHSAEIWRYLFPVRFEKERIISFLRYSVPLLPNAISWWVVGVSDRTIVSIVLGSSTNAIYSIACKIPNLAQNMFNLFHLSWQQSASETVNDVDRDVYYNDIFNRMFILISSVVCVILSVNFLIFRFLFEKEYYLGYYIVPILCIGIIFTMLSQFLGGIYIAQKKTKKNGGTTIIAAIVNIFVHAVLISFIGVFAAAISTLVSYVVLFVVRYLDIRKEIRLRFSIKSLISTVMLTLFVVTGYINIDVISYIMLLVAFAYFFFADYSLIVLAIKKLKGKLKNG